MLLVNLHEREVDFPFKELAQECWQESNSIIYMPLAKSQFEWRRDLDINYSLADVLSGQYFASFLIQKGELGKRF